jgi:membrane-associated phospholipid phosphatase
MEFWSVVTAFGLPEAWAAIAAGFALTYLILIHTTWQEPSQERRAFKAVAVLMVFTLILAFVTVRIIKETTQVPRPCTACTSPEMSACNPHCPANDFSFPSGHAATIFAMLILPYLITRRKPWLLLIAPAILVAWSRVALGVHTVPDIIGGSIIGIASALIIYKIHPRMRKFS